MFLKLGKFESYNSYKLYSYKKLCTFVDVDYKSSKFDFGDALNLFFPSFSRLRSHNSKNSHGPFCNNSRYV